MSLPDDRQYTAEHEWIQVDGDRARVGITQFAADALGDVVYLDLPEVGSALTGGQPCGEIESTKSVSDLYAPADGTVLEVNSAVVDATGLVNSDPYGEGWLFVMSFSSAQGLLDASQYAQQTGEGA